ncbi:MAG TPA: 1-deoxy-D-xylulose-5-phosphate synthase N-terminal domain-containing protein [Thermoanaerobaculia bacterium]|nr:1-deoxy-D-xylulose-5-phosphate synthase N-terminal domain-containing protein [Thermoanaerobaculia bacterium]
MKLQLIPRSELERVRQAPMDADARLALLANMCRANTIMAVKRAGSGHLGSSFSAMDIVTFLYHEELNTLRVGIDSPARDVYFSSKGHDVPGLYALLFSLGVIPRERLLRLRRMGGLDGHPDLKIPGIEANSGSLGMGISKGRGIAWAKRFRGTGGRVYVMIGDGELQEGQNYEALTNGVQQGVDNLTVIVDHNKVQSDKLVAEISDLGDIGRRFETFGWSVERCDGHDFAALRAALRRCRAVAGRPQVLVADTIKGRGVSFMEHPAALEKSCGLYPWHAGAPDDASYLRAFAELIDGVERQLAAAGLSPLALEDVEPLEAAPRLSDSLEGEQISQALAAPVTDEYVSRAYGAALLDIMRRRPDVVVLDADLSADCKIRDIENELPERFIENGIAEQDMVSMAGGLARHGLLPVVNSFASFLTARANEQIYNNATEGSKIVYACHYAGLIPAGPGKSHQSIRDVSLLAALPNMVVVEPCNAEEARMATEYAIDGTAENCAIRLIIGPSPRRIPLPAGYRLTEGRGVELRPGTGALLFAYGPVMLHEALVAAEGTDTRVVNMPWLNRIDRDWLHELVQPHETIFVIEDHAPVGALYTHILAALPGRTLHVIAVEGFPACGTPQEALAHHALNGASIARKVRGHCQ